MTDVQTSALPQTPEELAAIVQNAIAIALAAQQAQNQANGLQRPINDGVAAPGEGVWMMNLADAASRFSGEKGKFRLEPSGFVGSIMSIKKEVADDPYVRRAVSRGKVRNLTEEGLVTSDVHELMDGLILAEEAAEHQRNMLIENMSEDASVNISRYKNPNLSDLAEQSGPSRTPEQTFGANTDQPTTPKRVTRSGADTPVPTIEESEVKFVRGEKMREGDLTPETGL